MSEAMTANAVRVLNPVLALIGLGIARRYIGHWSVVDGVIGRRLIPIGWRLSSRADAACVMTDLDRFLRDRT